MKKQTQMEKKRELKYNRLLKMIANMKLTNEELEELDGLLKTKMFFKEKR
jgi:hypothetical protein